MNIEYLVQVKTKEGVREISGSAELDGALRLCLDLPEGVIERAEAKADVVVTEEDRIFMNGFQSWSYCPEYAPTDSIRGIDHFPKPLVRYFGLDRYGDHFFMPYPDRPGVTHGESYCYFRRGERFRLIGSLDEKPGYTVFLYDASAGKLTIRRDCEGIRCNGPYAVFDLFMAEGTENEVFDAWFDAMGVKPRTKEKIAGYTSWYNRYQKISEDTILSDLRGCEKVLRKGDLFQIDDGWEPFVGDWLEQDPKKFPNGMKSIADKIHASGLKAGLWLAPFVAQRGSKLLKEHPEWRYFHDGKPWYLGNNWGGFYALDIDQPGFQAYLTDVFRRVFDEWGFDLVKLDFLYGAAPFGNETETRAARMTRALEMLRSLCGEKQILGCGVPLMPAFGLMDYCRIGCDVGLDWNDSWIMKHTIRERVSTKHSIGNTVFRRELSGRAWINDPDVFILREDNVRLKPSEKRALAVVNSLFGGVLFCSDDMSEYGTETARFYEELLKNTAAKDISVETNGRFTVSYTVDGERKTVEIPTYE